MMWRYEQALQINLPDAARFLHTLNQHGAFFRTDVPITVARAPGRLDLMGGIADYSGALVLELPLGCATFVAAQPDDAPLLTIQSTQDDPVTAVPIMTIPLDALAPSGRPLPYPLAHKLLTTDVRTAWAAYVAGVLIVLARERGVRLTQGVRLFIDSTVPPGKGVSSSAALEVATMQAVRIVYGVSLDGRDLALLCQQVENLVVGAPCGVMDQMTAVFGEPDRLLALLCQPAELQGLVALPSDLEVWGIDSGIRHAVTGADYGSVRTGAFMGYRIIADRAGLPATTQSDGRVQIDDPQWHGYLANIPPSWWETEFREHVPEFIDGAAFLRRYGGTTDPVTRVDPARTYAVQQPTAHPIYEHHRVQLFRTLMQGSRADGAQRQLLGELMYQSHASYTACGLGSDGTDRLVGLVRAVGPGEGVYGAKITGGGSGGTVAVLAHRGSQPIVQAIADQYAHETGRTPTILGGSSSGAQGWGAVQLIIDRTG